MTSVLERQDAASVADRTLGLHSTGSLAAMSSPDISDPDTVTNSRIYHLEVGDAVPVGVLRLGDCWILLSNHPGMVLEGDDPFVHAHIEEPTTLIATVLDGFGLTKTDLAAVIGVSRQAVHGWIRGARMDRERRARLNDLAVLLAQLRAAGVDRPGVALTCPVFPDRNSAADLMRSGAWNVDRDPDRLIQQMIPRAVRPYTAADPADVLERIRRLGPTLTEAE